TAVCCPGHGQQRAGGHTGVTEREADLVLRIRACGNLQMPAVVAAAAPAPEGDSRASQAEVCWSRAPGWSPQAGGGNPRVDLRPDELARLEVGAGQGRSGCPRGAWRDTESTNFLLRRARATS